MGLIRELSSIEHEPYWGRPTSSVDWCEINYEYTPYIAEYFNTLSSFAMAILGLAGIYLHSWAERRFKVAFLAIFIVGLGSVAFHGTLLKISQAFDEVPMLYTAFSFLYITLFQRYKLKLATRGILAFSLLCYAVVTTYLITSFEGGWQFILFHISFGTAQFYALYQTIVLFINEKSKNAESEIIKLFKRGLILYCVAISCWLTDMLGCEFVNPYYETAILSFNPQLHAWWHILMTLGVYHLAVFMLFQSVDNKIIGKSATIYYRANLIPIIHITSVSKKRRGKQ
jgi:dihydroceramidase